MPVTGQLSMFGLESRPASPLDLEGLLAGAGQVVRMGGTARVSTVVDADWRARVLLREFALRGLAGSTEPSTVEGHFGVRTAYSAALAPLGTSWLRGAVKRPPAGFALDGRKLRLWTAASGNPDGNRAYVLGLGSEEDGWAVVVRALVNVGLRGELLGPRAGGPAYRIVGRRRLNRLAEMVGDPPPEIPAGVWPV
jgi:hypothetical protein